MKKIEFYYRDFCGFCAKTKRLLDSKKVKYKAINIWEVDGARDEMIQRTKGKTTVPQVFADNKYIGDSSQLDALERSGKLDTLLGVK